MCYTLNRDVLRMIPELNAAEKELLALLRREMADDKNFNGGKVRLTFYTTYLLRICLSCLGAAVVER